MNPTKRINIEIAMLLVIVSFSIAGSKTGLKTSAALPQDPAMLDRRISMVEQRMYFIESSLRRVEQQVASRPSSLPDPQSALVRDELENLKGQIQIINCGLAKLDERTLSPKLRQSGSDNTYKDPCRMNPETPLRLAR